MIEGLIEAGKIQRRRRKVIRGRETREGVAVEVAGKGIAVSVVAAGLAVGEPRAELPRTEEVCVALVVGRVDLCVQFARTGRIQAVMEVEHGIVARARQSGLNSGNRRAAVRDRRRIEVDITVLTLFRK